MKVQTDTSRSQSCNVSLSEVPMHNAVGHKDMTDNRDGRRHLVLHSSNPRDELDASSQRNVVILQPGSNYRSTECIQVTGELCNGTSVTTELENDLTLGISDAVAEISEDSRSLPEVCRPNAINDDEDLSYEIQQAYRMFHSFLLEKHKAITAPFWHPIGPVDHGDRDSLHSMCFRRVDEKFVNREYETITEFVADFRLMLENCYRFHGVDHWISKQAQKLEIILEQKLTLLSRTLREKTTLAVTSKGRFGTEDEKGPVGTSTRRRSVPRSLAAITVGGSESIMVQALRLEEQQRVKEEKRQRELEKKEAEETSAKEVEEWEQTLLSQAAPWPVETLWELPAIGHFLCLAQTALNLPEIVFFELERCLLMPRCSSFLAKVMTSLLCQPHRRATLHRRPALTYRRWEAELRQRVQGWYRAIGQAEDQGARAEQLGLCQRFFWKLGEASPLEEMAFHLLPFDQRVWLLKGLCDNVYETQKDVQDAVLGQPIHECRESILGYDSQENTYIHFPHFCGADLRVYCQSPCTAPDFPLPAVRVKRLELEGVTDGSSVTMGTGYECEEKRKEENYSDRVKVENGSIREEEFYTWGVGEDSLHDGDDVKGEAVPDQKTHSSFLLPCKEEPFNPRSVKKEPIEVEHKPRFNEEEESSSDCEPCLRVGENCYRGKSPANPGRMEGLNTPLRPRGVHSQVDRLAAKGQGPCPDCATDTGAKSGCHPCSCTKAWATRPASGPSRQASLTEVEADRMHTKKKKRKKKKVKELRAKAGQSKPGSASLSQAKAAKSTLRKAATTIKKKDKRKKRKLGKKMESKKTTAKKKKEVPKLPVEPAFKLVCTSLEELRELISKTEDEMDELESTKKRSGRWFFKREAVKDLHITLIRLLNELSPWEPKLVKAFQRNRLRLKKDYDDFKKHPEYDTFVREELVTDEGDGGMGKDGHSSTDITRDMEEYDKRDQTTKRDPGATEDTKPLEIDALGRCLATRPELIMASNEHRPSTRSSKRRQSGGMDEDLSPNKRGKMNSEDMVTSESPIEDRARVQSLAALNTQASETTPVVVPPMAGFHRSYNPIQALLAKSVGNKVTLMSQPWPAAMNQALQVQNKVPSASTQQTKPMSSSQPAPQPAPTQMHTPTNTPKSPVQVVYKMPGGLGLLRKDGSPVKFAVQPVLDQKTGDKIMQQVVILPTNLLIQRPEEKASQQPSSGIPVPVSKTSNPLPNSPGFSMSDNKIPIQQVAPLKDAHGGRTPATPPSLRTTTTPSYIGAPAPKVTTDQNSNRSPAPSVTPTDPSKPPDHKQELKTVCIRDSQSILVTTRGGNTGVVKLQTSDQNAPGSLPPSPVFTISAQFQAFLVSKSSPTTSTAPAVPATTTTQSLPTTTPLFSRGSSFTSVSKSPSKVAIPVSAASQSASSSVTLALNQIRNDSSVSATSAGGSRGTVSQTFITVNSLSPATQQANSSAPATTGRSGQVIPQTTLAKCVMKHPQKMAQPEDRVADRPPFQKMFLVTPSTNISAPIAASKVTSATAPSAVPGSRVMFISQTPASAYSTVSIPKRTLTSEAITTSLTNASPVEAMKVRFNLSQSISGIAPGALSKVQGISLPPGLTTKLPEETLNSNKKVVALTEEITKNTPVTVPRVHETTSSGLIFVQSSNLVTSSSQSVKPKGLVRGSGPIDGKTVAFSTLNTGHLASSVLLTAAQLQRVPSSMASMVSSLPNNRTGQAVGSSMQTIATPPLSSLVSKDTALLRGLVVNKPRFPTPLTTQSSPVKTKPITLPPKFTQPNSTPAQTFSTPVSAPRHAMSSIVRPSSDPTPTTSSVQQKIVINTSAPLAPGTQILINNTRFVVPAQGLGAGSHVLLISSPAVPPGAPQGASSTPAVPTGPSAPASLPVPPAAQGPRMVMPGTQAQHTALRLPTPSTAKVGPVPLPSPRLMTAVRAPLSSTGTSSLAQVSQQLGAAMSSGQQGLTNIMRTPSLLTPEGKCLSVASVQGVDSRMKETIFLSGKTQGYSQNAAKPALHTGLVNTLPKTQLTSVLPPVGTVISRTQVLPMVAMSPMSSTVSRMQTLPVATVPPIGSTISKRQATPIATVPPSNNSVIMAPCQPVTGMRTVQPEFISMPVVLTNPPQVLGKPPLQVSAPTVLTNPSTSKLLGSPDGAILNTVRSPALPSLSAMAKPMAAQVVAPTSSSVMLLPALETEDPLIPTHANQGRPNN